MVDKLTGHWSEITTAIAGLGIVGLFFSFRKAIKEITEWIETTKTFIDSCKVYFKDGEGKVMFDNFVKESDEALEAIADLLAKFKLSRQAKKLRDAIKK